MMTVKQTFKLYDVVNRHFHNEDDSKILVGEIEEIMDNKIDLRMNDFATRGDIADLRHDFLEHRAGTKQDIADLRAETKQEIAELRTDFARFTADINLTISSIGIQVERSLKDQLKWTIGLVLSIPALTIALLKLLWPQ